MASDISAYPVYSGAQRVLRFVSLLYLGWYVLSVAGAAVLVVAHFFFGFDAPVTLTASPVAPEVLLANAIIFVIDAAFNLCFATAAWMASNHPSMAKRFRVFAGVVLALTLATLAYDIAFGQPASAFSDFYSCVMVGFLLYLAYQISKEEKDGIAVDFQSLAKTTSGKHLRTESQLLRALEQGVLAE